MEAYFAVLGEPKELIWIEAPDHFFTGALDQFEDAVYGVTQTTNFNS
jgi:alpha/beta superfamily hydrolase